jgi:hypothetical protein
MTKITQPTYIVTLTDADVRLLRAGLAAHSIALEPYTDRSRHDTTTALEAKSQQRNCRDLSERLGRILTPKGA